MASAALALLLAVLGSSVVASPVWMPQFLTGGSGRNIRHLPCVSRRTAEQGVCMFALSCSRANGTHLGTCIDRFYFGSCCKIEGSLNNEENTLAAFPPSVTLATTAPPLDAPLSTFQTVNGNGIDEALSTASYTTAPTRAPAPPHSTQFASSAHTSGASPTPGSSTTPSKPPPSPPPVPTKPVTSKPAGTPTRPQRPPAPTPSKPVPARPVTSKPGTSKPATAKPGVTAAQRPQNSTRPQAPSKPPPPKPTLPTKPSTLRPPTPRPTVPTKPATGKPPVTAQKPVTAKPPVRPPTPKPTTGPLKPSNSTQRPPAPGTSRPPTPQRPTGAVATKPTSKPTYPTPRPTTTSTKPRPRPPVNVTTARPTIPTKRPVTTQKPYFTSAKPGSVTTKRPQTTTTKRPTVPTTTQSTQYVLVSSTNSTSPTPQKPPSTSGVTSTAPSSTTTPAPTTLAAGLVTWTVLETGSDTGATEKLPSIDEVGSTTPAPVSITTASTASASASTSASTSASPSASTVVTSASPTSTSEAPSTWEQLPGITISSASTAAASTPSTGQTTKLPSSPTESSTSPTTSSAAVSTSQNASTESPSPETTPETPGYGEIPLEEAEAFLNMSDYKQVCGRRFFPESRVVGGEKATFGKWPWQISLRQWRTNTYLHKCGAALLNENWAVTAAHCVENVPPADLLLRLGEHDLSSEDEPFGHEERRVQIVASHPQFDARTFEFDLALLRFNRPVAFRPNIVPVCVPEDDRSFVGETAHVTGWGRLYEDGPLPSVLQEVSVPVLNNSACEAMYRQAGYVEHIPHIFICAGWRKGGFDSCEGDSGGPMVIQRDDRRWLLAGVISWGIGCAEPNQPGVYTRVSQFRDWINQILQF